MVSPRGGRADSSDAGLAGLAPFCRIYDSLKSFAFAVAQPASLRVSPAAPSPGPPPREGVSRPARRTRLLRSPLRPRRPPRAYPAPAPPLRPHPSAAAPGFAARRQQPRRRQLRHNPGGRVKLGPAALGPRRAAESRAPGTGEAARGAPSEPRAPGTSPASGQARALLPPWAPEEGRPSSPPHAAVSCANRCGFTSAFNFYIWSWGPSSNFH
ncbi:vegetative cell wall protein gp1-like [Mustela erminea]|uniref:vegetative cell wall protein gp1-like n=1 Tax=Mustela erminea TaxID=36723 RepID=UPI00138677BC|nr:vegetative cell wall protein gp1-like [Mustela erminea]